MNTPNVAFINQDNKIFARKAVKSPAFPELSPRCYRLDWNMEEGFYFTEVEARTIGKSKVYGNVHKNVDRYVRTFEDRDRNTGVLLVGDKGCGKTLTAWLLAEKMMAMGYPVIIINQPYGGANFNDLMSMLMQHCMIFIDEFEKMYSERQPHGGKIAAQENLLTLLDGTVTGGKKLFVLTANDPQLIDDHMRLRPSRVHYFREYNGLDSAEVFEIANDMMVHKTPGRLFDMAVTVSRIRQLATYDNVLSVVRECDRYKEYASQAILEMFGASIGQNIWNHGTINYDPVAVFRKKEDGTRDLLLILEEAAYINQYRHFLFKHAPHMRGVRTREQLRELLKEHGDNPLVDVKDEGELKLGLELMTLTGFEGKDGVEQSVLSIGDLDIEFYPSWGIAYNAFYKQYQGSPVLNEFKAYRDEQVRLQIERQEILNKAKLAEAEATNKAGEEEPRHDNEKNPDLHQRDMPHKLAKSVLSGGFSYRTTPSFVAPLGNGFKTYMDRTHPDAPPV